MCVYAIGYAMGTVRNEREEKDGDDDAFAKVFVKVADDSTIPACSSCESMTKNGKLPICGTTDSIRRLSKTI